VLVLVVGTVSTLAALAVARGGLASAGVPVRAHGTVALADWQVSAPSVQMLDAGDDQDACAGAHVTLGYPGSAHS
jgi:hypothetical protein